MFNKFKIDELVICNGIGKDSGEKYNVLGIIIEKDSYYKDYCVRLENGKLEWFEEKYLEKI